jgi:predicted alpha/beta-hydrolase family hydrolase
VATVESGYTPIQIEVPIVGTSLNVSGLWLAPSAPRFIYVLAHGAGAGMRHPFLRSVSELLANEAIATFRYQFPYMEAGRRRPDPPQLLEATVASAVSAIWERADGLPILAGGKSMGGRMTSGAAAAGTIDRISGLIFLGFPLHPPGKPSERRASHLSDVQKPMLFLQGTRDAFARLERLRPVCERLGARATLHVVEGGDHSFKVLKRSGRTEQEVMTELSAVISAWAERVLEM